MNPRIHPAMQQDALKGALEEVGWIQDIIVNLRTSEEWGTDQGVETLVDGHLRVKLALRHGQPSVPVKYVDLSPKQERLAIATLDPITGYAAFDADIMSGLLTEIGEIQDDGLSDFIGQFMADEGIDLSSIEFPEYDESIADDVEYLECPECGHKWPK